MQDVIIIGGGPAGLTAAVYAARKKLSTLILTKELGGQLMWTREIENYMGYQFISGPELIGKFEEQVKRVDVEIKYEEVTGIFRQADGIFHIVTEDGEYHSKTVILASGKRPKRLEVPGEIEFTGLGVSYCATCDGPLFAGQTVAVVGGGNSAVQAAVEMSRIADKVYIVARRPYIADPVLLDKLQAAGNVEQLIGYITAGIHGTEAVEKISLRNINTSEVVELAVQGVFVEVGLQPNTEFLGTLAEVNERRELVIDCRTQTSVPGLFGAGDITNGPDKQIVIAAGDGAKAALMAYEYLLHNH